MRKQYNIILVVKQIDTVAAEFMADNNYLYMTYNGIEDDLPVLHTPAPSPHWATPPSWSTTTQKQ
jgi:hypothetical protein